MQFSFQPDQLPMTIQDYLSRPQSSETWIVQDLLPVGSLMTIYGGPKAGKSYLAVALGCNIAANRSANWLKWPIRQHGPVLYFSLDAPSSEWAKFYCGAALEKGLYQPGDPFYTCDKLQSPTPFDIQDVSTKAKLYVQESVQWVSEKEGTPPVLVVVDVFRKLFAGDEDKSGAQMNTLSLLEEATAGIAKVIVHHEKKPPQEGEHPLMAGGRGSNFLPGEACTTMRVVKKDKGLKAVLQYDGRGVTEDKLSLRRKSTAIGPDSFWDLDEAEESIHMQNILRDMAGDSVNAQATELARRTGLPQDAARGKIRRALGV